MNKKQKIITAGAVAAVAAVLVIVIILITSGSSSPQSAAGILQSNGYTVAESESGSQLPSTLSPYVSTIAVGSKGTFMEAVVVFKPGNTGFENQITSILRTQDPQLTYQVSGDDLVITGQAQSFSSLNNL